MSLSENIKILTLEKRWIDIIQLINENKQKNSNENDYQKAIEFFVATLLNDSINFPFQDEGFSSVIEYVYSFHKLKYFKLPTELHKSLILIIISRSTIESGHPYALEYPHEPMCAEVIRKYDELRNSNETMDQKLQIQAISQNWDQIFSHFYELINIQNVATFMSSYKIIDIIRIHFPIFPKYDVFIADRKRNGQNTRKRECLSDIFSSFEYELRNRILTHILNLTKPFEAQKSDFIMKLLKEESVDMNVVYQFQPPKIFISYSWDNEQHKRWVLDLSDNLRKNGVNIILDQYHLKPGADLHYFIENNISNTDQVIVIFTENYKAKAEKRQGGVGFEYSIITNEIYNDHASSIKFIPILRQGDNTNSKPQFMQPLIHIDMRNDETFGEGIEELLRTIYNEPKVVVPRLGEKPDFSSAFL